MKKITLGLTALAMMAASTSFAQGFYLKAGVGYNFPMGQQEFLRNDINALGGTYSETLVKASYGKGFNPGIGVGYMITKYIGVELGANFLLGGKTDAKINAPILNGNNVIGSSETSISSKAVGITLYPAIKLMAPAYSKVSPYSRIGLAIPVWGKINTTIDTKATIPSGTSSDYTKRETKGQFTAGLHGALGVNYDISDNIALWGEVNGQMLNVWSKTQEVTEHKVNGTDMLNTENTYSKETTYVKEVNSSSNNSAYNPLGYDASKPKDVLREQVSFHNVGISIGASFKF